ncbi:bifunctional 5,10-methylenetetrahydrofolate dehydrogenase/5,10-methenyltetrahydrofolate cyclohydrolase [Patescibacteria group bacterium]
MVKKQILNKKTEILSGNELAEEVLLSLRNNIVNAKNKSKKSPGLAIIRVGEDPASILYVRNKKKACEKIGINFHEYCFCDDTEEKDILIAISFLNDDPDISGIIVQLPLPKELNADKIIQAINPLKDVDGFNYDNIQKLEGAIVLKNLDGVIFPPTLMAVMTLLSEVEEDLAGKKAIIVSKNNFFASPLISLLKFKDIDSEIISPDDKDLRNKLKKSDIVIIAIGAPDFLKPNMIKEGTVIIDVGTTLKNGKILGDADVGCAKKASYISPVPGGVGPLTVAYLLKNVVEFWEKF